METTKLLGKPYTDCNATPRYTKSFCEFSFLMNHIVDTCLCVPEYVPDIRKVVNNWSIKSCNFYEHSTCVSKGLSTGSSDQHNFIVLYYWAIWGYGVNLILLGILGQFGFVQFSGIIFYFYRGDNLWFSYVRSYFDPTVSGCLPGCLNSEYKRWSMEVIITYQISDYES